MAQTSQPAARESGTTDQLLQEIVVTANKRVENLQDVGLAVAAITAMELNRQQVASLADIALAMPGLTFAQTANNTPVYTLRGVGFYDSTLAAYPDVSIYLDEVPLPFPTLSALTAFDLDRLEVMKGPQGTLFGNNATGGAINYVAAKPTNVFSAGVKVGVASFNTDSISGFISGPLADDVTARLAVNAVNGGPWQKTYAAIPGASPYAAGDRLGETNTLAARLLVDWYATDALKISVNVNGWRDNSDPQAPQYIAFVPQDPVPATFPVKQYPFAPANDQAAGWGPTRPYAHNDFFQSAVRADYSLTPAVTLTSITNYITYSHNQFLEGDGTPYQSLDTPNTGSIDTLTQELRLSNGGNSSLRWLVGANYEHSNVDELNGVEFANASASIPGVFYQAGNWSFQQMRNYAAFGNLEYDLSAVVTLKAGLRETRADRSTRNGSCDVGDGGSALVLNEYWNLYRQYLNLGGPQPIPGIGCNNYNYSLAGNPVNGLQQVYAASLDQNSTSWLTGVNIKPAPGLLLYANISTGFKAGGFPTLSGTSTAQFDPVVQEKLLDYEAGFKLQSRDGKVTVNGDAFYYDYTNKQLRAKIVDPFFGILDALVNVPKSRIEGAELEIMLRPVRALEFRGAVTYLDSTILNYTGTAGAKVDPSTGFQEPVKASFAGLSLPFSPRWEAKADIDYKWTVGSRIDAFAGATEDYQSSSTGVLVLSEANQNLYALNSRALLNLRMGFQEPNGRWVLTAWGKNVLNKYYWTNTLATFDTVVRYAGRPAEYGLTLDVKF
jgi:outer membrane receptor protein involved in Fe transport